MIAYKKAKDELLNDLMDAINKVSMKLQNKPLALDISKLET